jgi:hypothetical protein
MIRHLRTHQQALDTIVCAIADGESPVRDILAAVTPGGGKSLLPVIAAGRSAAVPVLPERPRLCSRPFLAIRPRRSHNIPGGTGLGPRRPAS